MATEPQADKLSGTREGYDRWAPVYDGDGNPLIALEQPCVRTLLGEVRDQRILDLGCGTGRHALWLAEGGATVTAIDFSPGMLDQARAKPGADTVTWLVHNLHEPLPFSTGSFDAIVSGLVLEHIRDPSALFAEVARTLTASGTLVVSTMHPAMMLRGSQARFTDPESGDVICPGSLNHQISDLLMGAMSAGLRLERIIEQAPDEGFAADCPRAQKYVGWPMLLAMRFLQG